jgi:hypothetical protein
MAGARDVDVFQQNRVLRPYPRLFVNTPYAAFEFTLDAITVYHTISRSRDQIVQSLALARSIKCCPGLCQFSRVARRG